LEHVITHKCFTCEAIDQYEDSQKILHDDPDHEYAHWDEEKCGGFETYLPLLVGGRYSCRRNWLKEDGVVNGARFTLVEYKRAARQANMVEWIDCAFDNPQVGARQRQEMKRQDTQLTRMYPLQGTFVGRGKGHPQCIGINYLWF